VDSVRRAIDYLHDTQAHSTVQAFNLSILPGTAFREEAASLGLKFQPRPPYFVLSTPTLNIEQMMMLMDEVQEAFGVEFDAPPSLTLEPWQPAFSPLPMGEGPGVRAARISAHPLEKGQGARAAKPHSVAKVDLDADPDPKCQLPPAADRAQAFTLWLRSSDFHAHRNKAAELVAQVLDDNPHTTLQVIVEPTAAPDRVTADFLQTLLASCYKNPTYLDRYYSMHPGSLMGAKRIAVLLRWEQRAALGQAWRDERTSWATLLWQGDPSVMGEEVLDVHEQIVPTVVA